MSGRRRELSLEFVLPRTVRVLRVNVASLRKDADERTVHYQKQGQPPGSFAFSFGYEVATVEEVLYEDAPAVAVGETVRFVSEGVIRSKQWHLMKERDGSRKIMYYDECAAFQEPLEGESALLVLRGVDSELDAHLAVMGRGLLPLSYREQVLAALPNVDADDIPSPPPRG